MKLRRTTQAVLATLAVLLIAGTIAGIGEAKKTVEGAPPTFSVPEPRIGDQGSYSTGIVVRFDDEAVFAGDEGRLRFERHEDLWYPDEDGIRPLAAYESWWEGSAMFDAQVPWQTTFHDTDGTTLAEAMPTEAWNGPEDRPSARVSSSSDSMPDGMAVVPSQRPGFCGFRSSLQGAPQDLTEPIQVQGLCPPSLEDEGFGSVRAKDGWELLVSGEDVVQGRPAVVFSWPEDPDALRLWFSDGSPYPVRMLVRLDIPGLEAFATEWDQDAADDPFLPMGLQNLYELYELVDFQAGGTVSSAPSAPLALAPPTQTGPDADGVDAPYPLSAAFSGAAAEPGALADLLARSPDAYVAQAGSLEEQDGDAVTRIWRFTATDGSDAVHVEAREETGPAAGLPALGGVLGRPTYTYTSEATSALDLPRPDQVPDLPTVSDLLRLWRFQGSDGQDWAFSIRCADPDCTETSAWIAAGTARTETDRLDGERMGTAQHLVVDGEGRFLYRDERPSTLGLNGMGPGTDYGWEPGDDWERAWGYQPLSAGFWSFPEETAVVVSVGAFAALAGVVYLAWPAVKSAPVLGLFSRTPKEKLLDHPARRQIHDLLTAEPGLHFQELSRRTGQGRGALDHHLNKLSKAGLVTAQVSPGYTCFYPTGQVDRRVMAALPFLKSPGARRLLEAAVAAPGSDVAGLAQTAGVARSTASYHVQRLVEAGLLMGTKQGASLKVEPTEWAAQALAA